MAKQMGGLEAENPCPTGSDGLQNTMAKQLHFEGFKKRNPCFGGSLLKGNNPKTTRPLDSKNPIHLVLRANQGGLRIPKTYAKVHKIIETSAKKHGVRVYSYVNVGNHIHFALKLHHVHRWPGFIRELTGRIALYMKKTNKEWKWLYRPFTRIVQGWKKAYRALQNYLDVNALEAQGIVTRQEIKFMKEFRAKWGAG